MNIVDVIRSLAGFAWIGAIVFAIMAVARANRNQGAKGLSSTAIILVIAALVMTTLGAGLVFIEPDKLGVVITVVGQGGIRQEPLPSGLHWIIPFAERVETYSILNQTYTMSSVTAEGQQQGDDSIQVRTKDGQQVYVDASVIYAINPGQAINLYRTWRNGYEDGLVRPSSRGVIRDVASQFGVEEIVSSKRAEMEQAITEELTRILADNNLVLKDFLLRNIRFSDEYAAAVEQKQIAEQQAQQAKFVVESKKQEAEQARQVAQGQADAAVIAAKGAAEAQIIQAEAQAKANELIGQSLQANPEILQYQYILKLSPGVQTIFIPSGNQFILPLPNTSPNTIIPETTP
jgi:regulator of protease activity HflC (stomatin/prohibitin superfamily)